MRGITNEFLDRIFKKKKLQGFGIKVTLLGCEHLKRLVNSLLKNNEDGLSTQILLENGRSIILTKDNDTLAQEKQRQLVLSLIKNAMT